MHALCLNFMEILAYYLHICKRTTTDLFVTSGTIGPKNRLINRMMTSKPLTGHSQRQKQRRYTYIQVCTYKNKTIKLRFPISITFILLVIVTQNVEYGMQKSIAMVLSKTSFKRSKKYTVRFYLLQFLLCSKMCILVSVHSLLCLRVFCFLRKTM